MELDVLKVSGIPESRDIPIQPAHPTVNSRESRADITQIALEMLHVDRVKPNDGGVESDISLGDLVAEEIRFRGRLLLGEVGFNLVERGEERCHGFLVGFLRGCETGFVYAIIDVVVDPFVGGIDLGLEGLGEEVDFLVLLGKNIVEFMVKHADDFGALVL